MMRQMRQTIWMSAGVVVMGSMGLMEARDFRVPMLGAARVLNCAACHVSPSGGGPRNPFGRDVEAIVGSTSRTFWSPTLAAKDSDGDGFTNGEEMADPDGDGVFIAGAQIFNPGLANSKPPPKADPLGALTVAAAGGQVQLSWVDGAGPFAVQMKSSLSQERFTTLEVTTQRSYATAQSGEAGFFRIADLANAVDLPMQATLNGQNERPNPVVTTGRGTGTFVLKASTLEVDVTYEGLSGTATAAHIHGPANASGTATIMISLESINGGSFGTSGVLKGTLNLTATQRSAILGGQTYVNIHTAANPSGEVRGQILP